MTIKYIIGHWTAGMLIPNKTDLTSYQLLIDGEGKIHNGLAAGCTSSTGGMNSITYNISCCGGLSSSKLTRVQMEAFYSVCADKIKEYGLNANDFYTHAEIGEMCRSGQIIELLPSNSYLNQNIGKIDLTTLPDISGDAFVTGDFIRNKIKWYLK